MKCNCPCVCGCEEPDWVVNHDTELCPDCECGNHERLIDLLQDPVYQNKLKNDRDSYDDLSDFYEYERITRHLNAYTEDTIIDDLHNDTIIGLDGTHPVAWGDHQWFMDDHNLANMQAGSQFPEYKGSFTVVGEADFDFNEWEMGELEMCAASICLHDCKTGEALLARMREYAHPNGSSYPY